MAAALKICLMPHTDGRAYRLTTQNSQYSRLLTLFLLARRVGMLSNIIKQRHLDGAVYGVFLSGILRAS